MLRSFILNKSIREIKIDEQIHMNDMKILFHTYKIKSMVLR